MLSMLTLCSEENFILTLVARHPLWQTLQEPLNNFPCVGQTWRPYSHQIPLQVTFSTLSTWRIKETETRTCIRLDPQTKSMWVSFWRNDSEIPWFLLCTCCHLKNAFKVKSKIKKTERSSNLTPAGVTQAHFTPRSDLALIEAGTASGYRSYQSWGSNAHLPSAGRGVPFCFPELGKSCTCWNPCSCQNFRACAQNGNLHSLPILPGSGTKPESLGRQLFKEHGNRLVKEPFFCKRYWNWTWPGPWTLLSCSFLIVIPELLLKGKTSSLYCSSNQQEHDRFLSQHELSLPTSAASPSPQWKREKRKNSLLKKTNPKLCNCCFRPTGEAFV